jgi:GNAT superfamily N-acetyltransferase
VITIRTAAAGDVGQIREVFLACYGTDYPYPTFYDPDQLTRMVYSDNQILLVAEDQDGVIVGTASVILEIGAMTDLVGEFGRLAVHPEHRGGGVGGLLMRERVARVEGRLHVGVVDARIAHPFSCKIAEAHGFAPVGLLPLRMHLGGRESLCLLARYFGEALSLRRNHPRIIPEAGPIAEVALEHCGLGYDTTIDEHSAAYRGGDEVQLEELTTEGYTTLLRIERGRVHRREIFGPMRLHYGLFKLQARRSHYLLARRGGRVVGGVGWSEDDLERVVRVFELIAVDDQLVRPLLESLERKVRTEGRAALIEVDVSAHAPRMQRTLLELGFLPVAYVPAMVFADVERLDIVRMIRLYVEPQITHAPLSARAQAVADLVIPALQQRSRMPEIERAVGELALFQGLDQEQVRRLAGMCRVVKYAAGDTVLAEGESDGTLSIILTGQVEIHRGASGARVGVVGPGECLGEMAVLTPQPHSATGVALTETTTAALRAGDIEALVRQRPDIGVIAFRNLARGLGGKLARAHPAQ